MGPNQLSAELREIADKIEKSKQPSRALVASALKQILASLTQPETPAK